MKKRLLPILLPLLPTAALAQHTTPLTLTATSTAHSPNTHWTLQNLIVQIPFDTPSVLPPEIYPHNASIEFSVVQTRQPMAAAETEQQTIPADASVVNCSGSWKPGSGPSKMDLRCEAGDGGGGVVWRFGGLERWQERDFWIDVLQASYVLPNAGTNDTRNIQLTYAPIHIKAQHLLCTIIRLANTIYHCSLSYLPFTAASSRGTLESPRTDVVQDDGLVIRVDSIKATQGGKQAGGANSIKVRVGEAKKDAKETMCEATLAYNEAWPTTRNPRKCSDGNMEWFFSSAISNTSTTDSAAAAPLDIAGDAALRIQRRIQKSISMNGSGRADWKVDYELQYEMALKSGRSFDWSCKDSVCEGKTKQEAGKEAVEIVFVDWKRSRLLLS